MFYTCIIIAFLASAISSCIMLPWLLSLCHRFGLYDQPSARKVHQSGIPRLGGIVFVPAAFIGMVAAFASMNYEGISIPETIRTSTLLIGTGALLLYLIGIIDDLTDIKAWLKFVIQFFAACTLPVCKLYIDSLYGFMGIYELPLCLSYLLTIFIVMLVINAINLIDGIDGLAGCLSLIAFCTFAYKFMELQSQTFVLCCVCMCGTICSFLIFNIWGNPEKGTKTFMGDSGSLLLGIALSYFSIKYMMHASPTLPTREDGLLVSFTALLIPSIDLVRVALCRIKRGQHIFKADKTHLHHKFLAAGFTMSQALVAILLLQTTFMALNFALFYRADVAIEWIVLIDIIAYTLINIILPVAPEAILTAKPYAYNDESLKAPDMDYQGESGLVSIIMPTYNSARFVAESIDNILAQTYRNWELIISDDCSTDETMEILRSYANRDERIRIYQNAQNSGAGFSRNSSITKARGEYIAFCDSDDCWMPTKLEAQLQHMKEHNTNICFAPYYTCNEKSEYLGYVPAPDHVNLFSMMCDDKIGFLTCIYNARNCGKHFMPLQRKRQDYAFLLNLMRTCPNAYSIQQPLGRYRLHNNSISAKKTSLLKFNALTYRVVFGWPMPICYAFLFTFFMPCYFWKRIKNIFINIYRTELN